MLVLLSLQNVAAVTATSTRAPIYKAFARAENIGDVTAKGECISNIADLVGIRAFSVVAYTVYLDYCSGEEDSFIDPLSFF
jgi:hypothetical protein